LPRATRKRALGLRRLSPGGLGLKIIDDARRCVDRRQERLLLGVRPRLDERVLGARTVERHMHAWRYRRHAEKRAGVVPQRPFALRQRQHPGRRIRGRRAVVVVIANGEIIDRVSMKASRFDPVAANAEVEPPARQPLARRRAARAVNRHRHRRLDLAVVVGAQFRQLPHQLLGQSLGKAADDTRLLANDLRAFVRCPGGDDLADRRRVQRQRQQAGIVRFGVCRVSRVHHGVCSSFNVSGV
jgi:hypothetical protein